MIHEIFHIQEKSKAIKILKFMAVPTIYRYLIEHYENNGLEEEA
jgi:hypothetical protein